MKTLKSHIILFRIMKVLLSFLIGGLLFGCSPSHVLHHTTDENQVFTYIDFQRNHKVYEVSASIESDLEKTIKILGFEGNKFLVELSPDQDKLSLKILGKGFDIRRCTPQMHTIIVRERDSLISISVVGKPGVDYDLKITSL